MNAILRGALLKRTRLAHVFSTVSALCITLTICLQALVHKHTQTHIMKCSLNIQPMHEARSQSSEDNKGFRVGSYNLNVKPKPTVGT